MGKSRKNFKTPSDEIAGLRFVDDNTPVPKDANLVEEDKDNKKSKYVVTYDALGNINSKRQVKTYWAIQKSRLLYVDDKTPVSKDVSIIQEGLGLDKKKYAVIYDAQGSIISKRQVKTATAISKSRLLYSDDKTAVSPDAIIIEEGTGKRKRKYAVTYDTQGNINSKREIKNAAALINHHFKFLDDASLVSKDAIIIEESRGKRKRNYAVTYDDNQNIKTKREIKSGYLVDKIFKKKAIANLITNLSQTFHGDANINTKAFNSNLAVDNASINVPVCLTNDTNKDTTTEEEVIGLPQWLIHDLNQNFNNQEVEAETESTNVAFMPEIPTDHSFTLMTQTANTIWSSLFQPASAVTKTDAKFQPTNSNQTP